MMPRTFGRKSVSVTWQGSRGVSAAAAFTARLEDFEATGGLGSVGPGAGAEFTTVPEATTKAGRPGERASALPPGRQGLKPAGSYPLGSELGRKDPSKPASAGEKRPPSPSATPSSNCHAVGQSKEVIHCTRYLPISRTCFPRTMFGCSLSSLHKCGEFAHTNAVITRLMAGDDDAPQPPVCGASPGAADTRTCIA